MAQILALRPNKLVYPGTRPGFDPTHVASRSLVGSVIPAGNNAINLAGSRFQVGTGGSGNTAGTDGSIGPVIIAAAANSPISFNGNSVPDPMVTGNGFTFASIFRPTSVAGNNPTGMGLAVLYQLIIGSGGNFGVRQVGTVNFDSGIAPVYGVPYFHAASILCSGSNMIHNHVVVRLDTGSIAVSGPITTAASLNSFVPFSYPGISAGGGNSANGSVGPAMLSARALSLPELLQWAQDPWSFWYPQNLSLALKGAFVAAPPESELLLIGVT